jgi:hypothetical protein
MKIFKKPVGKMLAASLSAVLTVALSLNAAYAADTKNAVNESTSLTQAHVWYDGVRERQVWLNPGVVAEFDPSPQGEDSAKSINPSAAVLPVKHKQHAVRLWQLDNTANSATRNLKTIHPQGKYSAVFHDGPSTSGRMRALPGNIIVYLDPQWSKTTVNNWLSTHKLEVVKKLEIGPNIYVIKTGPGLEALDTANTLYRSGEVKAAFPDWWREVTTR